MIVVPMIVIVIRQVGSWLALVNNLETLSTGKFKDLLQQGVVTVASLI
jgi:hypothetical protein